MGSPVASVEIQAKSTGLAAQLREIGAKFGAFADRVGGWMAKKGQGINEWAGKRTKGFGKAFAVAGGNLLSSAVSAGAGALEDAAKSAFTYQDKLTRLQILANDTPAAMGAFSESVRNASDVTGKSKEEILDAASAYVALTGDMNVARSSTLVWAKVAQATNSTVADISQTAAAMTQNLKIGPDDMEAVFSALNVQGKAGAIELKDLAGSLSSIAPQWAMFGKGTGVRGVRDLGAALQIVKRGFGGDASETVTGLQSFLTAVVKHAPQLEQAGVKGLFTVGKDGKKSLTDVFSIVDAIGKSELVKDPTAMEKAFGRVEAYRAYLQLSANREEMQKLSDAGEDAGSIQRDLDTYMNSSAGRTAKAMEHLKNTIAEAFTPERIERFAAVLEKVTKGLEVVFGTLDHFINGPSKEQGAGEATRDFVAQANPSTGDSQQADADAVARAHNAMESADLEEYLHKRAAFSANHSDIETETQFGANSDVADKYGSWSAYQAGAGAFLKSEGGKEANYANDPTNNRGYATNQFAQQGNRNAGREFLQRGVDAFGLGAKPIQPKDIANAIANGLEGINLTITVDGKVLATSVKKSPTHRQGVAK